LTAKKTIPLPEREIRGLTWKQVTPIVGIIVGAVWVYFNITKQIETAQKVSESNNEILQEIRNDRKEEARLFNIRIADIENRQRTDNVRITLIEAQLNIKTR
jgi:hypothetical protein